MLAASIPAKFPKPFAADAGGGYTRPIPEASQIGIQNGAASLTDGFPPLNFIPVDAGGTPPFGQDMNGLMNQTTSWSQWQAAGGAVTYDAAFSAAIGGYPKGAVLQQAASVSLFWISEVDNNTSDPDTSGPNWLSFPSGAGGGIDQLVGDVLAGPGAGTQTATLATVNADVGTFVNPTMTVDAKGRILSISSGGGGSGIDQLTGDGTAGPGSGSQALTLATVNSNIGSFTNANVTVNAKGLVTAVSSGTNTFTSYTSALYNPLPGAGTLTAFPHGFGVVPVGATIVLQCLAAESGWSVGDQIIIGQFMVGISVWMTSVGVFVFAGGTPGDFPPWSAVAPGGENPGQLTFLSAENWGLGIKAWV